MMAAISRNIDIIDTNANIMSIFQPVELQEKDIMVEKTMKFFGMIIRQDYASFIVLYPLTVMGITWWIGNRLKYHTTPMTKDGPKQKPKPFSSFRYPRWLVNVIMLLILVSFIVQLLDGSESTTYISLALQNISLYLLAIQGTAVLDYILKRNSVFSFTPLRVIVLMLIIVLFAGIIPLMIGMMDVIIDIRKTYANMKDRKFL